MLRGVIVQSTKRRTKTAGKSTLSRLSSSPFCDLSFMQLRKQGSGSKVVIIKGFKGDQRTTFASHNSIFHRFCITPEINLSYVFSYFPCCFNLSTLSTYIDPYVVYRIS